MALRGFAGIFLTATGIQETSWLSTELLKDSEQSTKSRDSTLFNYAFCISSLALTSTTWLLTNLKQPRHPVRKLACLYTFIQC